MVKQGLKTEVKTNQSLEKIISCVDNKTSFILEAGAGSGKTRSLIETLKHILIKDGDILCRNNQKIICITYTNVAKNEIIERIENNPLVNVSTIHQFLWHIIKNYQKELLTEILEFNSKNTKMGIENLEKIIDGKRIEYSEYGRSFENGQITHEDVIEFSSKLFEKYPKILKIASDKFPYILVDEYQDTEKRTIIMLLDYLLKLNQGKVIIGFFGDSMQNIYDTGVGKIPENYITDKTLELITKEENFRCSKKVIEVLNNIRENIQQKPAGNNLEGSVLFINCNGSGDVTDYEKIKKYLVADNGWDIDKTKILLLTHKDIANKAGYENLLNAFSNLSFGRERLFKKGEVMSDFFLNKLEIIISLYQNKKYSEFIQMLGKDGFIIKKHDDKYKVDQLMQGLIKLREDSSIKNVLDYTFQNNILAKPLKMIDFENKLQETPLPENMEKKKKFYDDLMDVKYKELISANEFIEDHTPYSTNHGVKGAEFENVLMIIDDGSWFKYKFNDVFANNKINEKRFNETLNLLYVCCSRAKNRLAVMAFSKMDANAIVGIKRIFGDNNYIMIDDIK